MPVVWLVENCIQLKFYFDEKYKGRTHYGFFYFFKPFPNQSTYDYVKFHIEKFDNWIQVWEGILP